MAEAQKLAVRTRTVLGKKVNALRRQGLLPGVLFGGHLDSTPVETDLQRMLSSESANVVVQVAAQADSDDVVAVERERMLNRRAST